MSTGIQIPQVTVWSFCEGKDCPTYKPSLLQKNLVGLLVLTLPVLNFPPMNPSKCPSCGGALKPYTVVGNWPT